MRNRNRALDAANNDAERLKARLRAAAAACVCPRAAVQMDLQSRPAEPDVAPGSSGCVVCRCCAERWLLRASQVRC